MNFAAFDLEGPLSPQDNAYELMGLFPDGGQVFEVISRYDDLLTLEDREGYEPGDTLALIVPFLVCHRISAESIAALAAKASLTGGADKLIPYLAGNRWKVCCISTSYEQYAMHITQKLGIYAHNVASTRFPIDELSKTLCKDDAALLQRMEGEILTMSPAGDDDARIKKSLDKFFWKELPATEIGKLIEEVKPVGGQRKVDALSRFADKYDQPLSGWVVVGDSITDFKMLRAVEEAGGVSIAFNANEFAVPYATMSLASVMINDLTEVFQTWQAGGRRRVERLVKSREKSGGRGDRGFFNWTTGRKDLDDIIATHKRIRRLVRDEAGKLG